MRSEGFVACAVLAIGATLLLGACSGMSEAPESYPDAPSHAPKDSRAHWRLKSTTSRRWAWSNRTPTSTARGSACRNVTRAHRGERAFGLADGAGRTAWPVWEAARPSCPVFWGS